ncbi:pPIWI_RE module domain-containing protein [Nocardia nepalensis]|uniref:pPIWI_RE module domain-containing protein n=1 Tax=Nocardia nepalensis TaxID=3375448 RepID=UPI003B67BA23
MPKYTELQHTAFVIRPQQFRELTSNFHSIRFPRSWIDPITDLMQSGDSRRKSVPIASLNRAMLALVPDIAAIGRGVGRPDYAGDWMYSTAPTSERSLELILRAWLQTVVTPKHADEASKLWERLPKHDIKWQSADLHVLNHLEHHEIAADTAAATEHIATAPKVLRHLIPESLAAELLRRSDRPDGFPVGFRRCPTGDAGSVELISWPPQEDIDRRNQRWPYSHRVRLSLQSIPFQPEPRVHVSVGIRRWCPRTPKTNGDSVNAYILSKVPWIDGLPQSRSFRIAPTRWRKDPGGDGFGWHRELHHLFDNITFDNIPIDPYKLGADPLTYLDASDNDLAAALVYNTRAGYDHHIGSGATARDRNRIRDWIADVLGDIITPVPALQPVSITLPAITDPAPAEVRQRIATALNGQPLTVEIHWDTASIRDAAIQAVVDDLGLDPAGPTPQMNWATEELDIELRTREIGSLAAPLEVDLSIRDTSTRNRRAAQPREQAVLDQLGNTPGALAFIELRNRDGFKLPGSDPKAALRVGFARSGRLTQFMTPGKVPPTDEKALEKYRKALEAKAKLSWRDLRRQLVGSLRPVRSQVNKLTLPHPTDTVAIYMLRRNATDHSWGRRQQLPVAIWTSSDTPAVWGRTLGGPWELYPDLLRRLATGSALRIPEVDEKQVQRFVLDEVIATLHADRPTLLLTWSQNLRLDWQNLQISKALIDRLAVGDTAADHLAPQLRHVMLRTADGDETPEVYGETGDVVGLPSGLFRYPGSNRVFASIASKPGSAKTLARPMGTRADDILDQEGRSLLDTRRSTFNPQCVELTVMRQHPDDDPRVWAAVAHAQRRLADTYGDTLLLPWPLHLAKKATEYAIPDLAEGTFSDEIDDQEGAA